MGRPLRVALVVANVAARYGGPAHAALTYAEALTLAGADVRLVTTTQDGDARLSVPVGRPVSAGSGYEIFYYPPAPSFGSRPASPRLARGILDAMRWADVAHVSSLYLPHNVFVHLASKATGTPYIIRPHGILEPYQRQFSRSAKRLYDVLHGTRYLRDAAGFHFTSQSEAEAAADLIGTARSFVTPIPLPTPADRTASPHSSKTVLFLGRVTAKKRVDLLLRAWPQVHHEHPDAELVIAGPVDDDQRHLVTDLPTGARAVGLVHGQAKDAVLTDAALFVLPSHNENFGVAVAEAMSRGLPVIVSDQVALAPSVAEFGLGTVLPDMDADSLARAISDLLADPQRRTHAGQRAATFAREQFGVEAVGRALETALERIVHRAPLYSPGLPGSPTPEQPPDITLPAKRNRA